ncbi:hypothetical protein [Kribbella soli]|uniref:ArsR family transcriptional regulator n=1 Tax=Kribbella soli TaxID=1124743 RepID=A0A4R0HPX1_9ACTN|nr:hypothetical protein [Kribbella soli]TCC12030.1 hypothetical protein E0H45_12620 [Kribbella soli]
MTDDWEQSELPRRIVGLLAELQSLGALADALDVTDARVLWYLGKLRTSGRVVEDAGVWRRTETGAALAESPGKVDRAATPKYGFRWVLTPVDLHPLDDVSG